MVNDEPSSAPPSSPKPPRPPLSDRTPAPVASLPAPTGPVAVSRGLWMASAVVGAAAIGIALLYRDAQLDQLTQVIDELRPGLEDTQRDSTIEWVFTGSLVAIGIVTLGEFALARLLPRGKGRIRWVLAGVLLVHAAIALLATAFVAQGTDGLFAATMIGSQLVLACAALVVGFLPGAGAWFRHNSEATEQPVA